MPYASSNAFAALGTPKPKAKPSPPPVDDADAAAARAASAAALEAAVFSGRLASVSNWADSDDEFAGVGEGGEWVSLWRWRGRRGRDDGPPRKPIDSLLSAPAHAAAASPTPHNRVHTLTGRRCTAAWHAGSGVRGEDGVRWERRGRRSNPKPTHPPP